MLNSMLNVIITEKLYNEEYITAHTENFGRAEGEHRWLHAGEDGACLRDRRAYPARSGAAVCLLESLADILGMGISQHVHGTDNARCLIALALITGQIGRKGTGLHPLRGQNNVQGASDAGLIPMVYPDYQSVDKAEVRHFFESLWARNLIRKRV